MYEYGSRVGLLAADAHVRRARHQDQRVRGRHGARAAPRGGRGHRGGRARGGEPRLSLDRLPVRPARTSSASTCGGRWRASRASRGAVRSAGTPGASSPNTRRLVVEEGGFLYDADAYNDDLPYWDGGGRPAAPRRALHAGQQRHEVRDAAGLRHRRRVAGLRARRLRRPLRRGRRPSEDDVGRAAHAPHGAARAGGGPRPAFSTTCSATIASGSAGASTSPATGSTVIRTGRTSAERRPYMPPPPDPTAPPPVQSKVYGCTR